MLNYIIGGMDINDLFNVKGYNWVHPKATTYLNIKRRTKQSERTVFLTTEHRLMVQFNCRINQIIPGNCILLIR